MEPIDMAGRVFLWEEAHEKEPPARELRLVVPAAMGEAEVLRRIVMSVEAVRGTLVRHGQWWAEEVEAEKGRVRPDPVRTAFYRGAVWASRSAHENLDHELLDGLGLWLMEEMQDPPSREQILSARELWRVEGRPEVPMGALPDAGELMGLVREQRDAFVGLAVGFNKRALTDYSEDGARCEEYMGAARAFAQAADDLEATLARAFGSGREYRVMLDEHGPWQARVIEVGEESAQG